MKPKLLVVELWGVGDLVMATPFLCAASEKYSVTLLAKPYARDLQRRFWPEVEVIPFVAPWTAFERKYRLYSWPWRGIIRLVNTLRKNHFDIGLSARIVTVTLMGRAIRGGDPRDHLLLALAGARRRIGFSRAGSGILLNQSLSKPAPGSHRYEHWRALANELELNVPQREFIPMPQARPGFVLVHTGAAQRVRVWPMERFRSVVHRLREQGLEVRVACDANQRDWWLAVGEADVATPHTVSELLQLMDHAAIFIGNDSGPGHVAAFSGVPTCTIFGPQLPELFAPLHPASVWLEGRPCPHRPCSDYCHYSKPHCMWDLSEETVWPRIRDFVERHAGFVGKSETAATMVGDEATRVSELPARKQPRQVLHVHNSADIYGASRSLVRLLKTMDRQQFEPLVVLPQGGLLSDFLEAQGVEVVLHRRLSIITRPVFYSWRIVPFLANYPLSVLFLWRLIRRRRIELVHTNTGVILSPALAARLARVAHVWHIRDWFQEFWTFWPVLAWYIRTLSRKVVAVSNAIAGQFSPRNNVVVIHNGFSLEEFKVPKQRLRSEFRERYGLGDQFVVGCVGRIKLVRKGQEVLVQATALLKQRGLDIKALIVGAPFPGNEGHLQDLLDLTSELGVEANVVFTGELADPRGAYAAMDVLAMTSAQPEPFGGVVMEAMSMGLPAIATDIGGSLDQVVEGVTGLFVPPGDPVALADAIEKLMRDPASCQRMGVTAVGRIRDHFSLVEMTGRIERLFDDSIGAKKRSPGSRQ